MADLAFSADSSAPCGGCGTPTPVGKLTPHETFERIRTPRTGEPPGWERPVRSARLVDRSPRYSSYLVTRDLCPDCLARAQADAAAETGRLQRIFLSFGAVAVVAAVVTLAFPHIWPDLERVLSLRVERQALSPATAPAASPYKPPFAATMPTAPGAPTAGS